MKVETSILVCTYLSHFSALELIQVRFPLQMVSTFCFRERLRVKSTKVKSTHGQKSRPVAGKSPWGGASPKIPQNHPFS